MSQNLISANLSAEDAATVLESLSLVKSKMPFLSTLQSTDVSGLFKPGTTYLPLIEKTHQVVQDHPEILPPIFSSEEFLKDYNLLQAIRPILSQIEELAEGLQKTSIALGSDTLVAALEVYASVKQNKDKVPGLSVVSDEMAAFFKKTKVKSDVPK